MMYKSTSKKLSVMVYFVPNNIVATVVAKLILMKRDVNHIVFANLDRVDIKKIEEAGATVKKLARWPCLLFLLKNYWFTYECCIPHLRLGNIAKKIALKAKSIELIDDGLDSFRNNPKNLDWETIVKAKKYNTFNYDVFGKWVYETKKIVKTCELIEVESKNKKIIDLSNYDLLVIESPPLNKELLEPLIGGKSVALFRHSNVDKRVLNGLNHAEYHATDIDLERSLGIFRRNIIVGESMVAIYAAMYKQKDCAVDIYIRMCNKDNLQSMVELCKFGGCRIHFVG